VGIIDKCTWYVSTFFEALSIFESYLFLPRR
jgi:hypothetical protein